MVTFLYNFLTNTQFFYNILQEFDVQLFYTFTCQNILKQDCSNIFYTKYFSRPQPGLLLTHGLEGALPSNVLERGGPMKG